MLENTNTEEKDNKRRKEMMGRNIIDIILMAEAEEKANYIKSLHEANKNAEESMDKNLSVQNQKIDICFCTEGTGSLNDNVFLDIVKGSKKDPYRAMKQIIRSKFGYELFITRNGYGLVSYEAYRALQTSENGVEQMENAIDGFVDCGAGCFKEPEGAIVDVDGRKYNAVLATSFDSADSFSKFIPR